MKIKALLLGVIVALITHANAATIYTHTYATGDASRLWTVDGAGGVATAAASPFGVDEITDLAMACDGTLFAVDFDNLYTVAASGVATRVNQSSPMGLDLKTVGLDFADDGTLFGLGLTGQVFTVDTRIGVATVVFQSTFSYVGDLAFAGMEGTNYVFYATRFESGGQWLVRLVIDVHGSSDSESSASSQIAPGANFAALDFVGASLIGLNNLDGGMYRIDTTTGVGSLVGQATGLPPDGSGYGGMTSLTQPTAVLSIARTGSQVEITWQPALTNFVLESAGLLPAPAWSEVLTPPTITDGKASVILDAPGPAQFFRLKCR
jgi:hypothetical protein